MRNNLFLLRYHNQLSTYRLATTAVRQDLYGSHTTPIQMRMRMRMRMRMQMLPSRSRSFPHSALNADAPSLVQHWVTELGRHRTARCGPLRCGEQNTASPRQVPPQQHTDNYTGAPPNTVQNPAST